MTMRMIRWAPTLATVTVLLTASCGSKDGAGDERAAFSLEAALVVGGQECQRSDGCQSGVCTEGRCTPLRDANQAWMEHRVAARSRAASAGTPGLSDKLLETWVPRFEKEKPYARGRFAGLLGALGDPRFVPVLRTWAESPQVRVRIRATLALGALGDVGSFDSVLGLLDHRSEAVVLLAADAMVKYSRDGATRKRAVAALLGLLQHDGYRVRQRAVRRLGDVSKPPPAVGRALEAIVAADEDGFLHQDALRSLDRN